MEEIESEESFRMPKYKSCDLCIHKGVCGAYNSIPGIKDAFEMKYPYAEFPAKPIALAIMCKEYTEIESGETVNEYKSSGCGNNC